MRDPGSFQFETFEAVLAGDPDALELTAVTLAENPRLVGCVLLRRAVERGFIDSDQALEFGVECDFDPQIVCEALAPMLAELGRISPEKAMEMLGGEPS